MIFQAVIDKDTCNVCKERHGKEAFYEWKSGELKGKDLAECESEICRCILVEDCRPFNYKQRLAE